MKKVTAFFFSKLINLETKKKVKCFQTQNISIFFFVSVKKKKKLCFIISIYNDAL